MNAEWHAQMRQAAHMRLMARFAMPRDLRHTAAYLARAAVADARRIRIYGR